MNNAAPLHRVSSPWSPSTHTHSTDRNGAIISDMTSQFLPQRHFCVLPHLGGELLVAKPDAGLGPREHRSIQRPGPCLPREKRGRLGADGQRVPGQVASRDRPAARAPALGLSMQPVLILTRASTVPRGRCCQGPAWPPELLWHLLVFEVTAARGLMVSSGLLCTRQGSPCSLEGEPWEALPFPAPPACPLSSPVRVLELLQHTTPPPIGT